MKTPVCPECDYTPDIDQEYWVKLLIAHIANVHNWELQDAKDYVEGRPYKGVKPNSPDR